MVIAYARFICATCLYKVVWEDEKVIKSSWLDYIFYTRYLLYMGGVAICYLDCLYSVE